MINKQKGIKLSSLSLAVNYFPFGLGGLFPLPPPDGLPVVLGALTGLFVFAIIKML
jgi:hypothetical protein